MELQVSVLQATCDCARDRWRWTRGRVVERRAEASRDSHDSPRRASAETIQRVKLVPVPCQIANYVLVPIRSFSTRKWFGLNNDSYRFHKRADFQRFLVEPVTD